MKRAGVIGWPIGHSLSPILHRYWLREYGVKDAEYGALEIPAEGFTTKALERLRDAEAYVGFNVTVPHKERAFEIADTRDDAATFAGAANLLFFRDGQIRARNTDISGFQDSLMQSLGSTALTGKNIVLLGAGGAARAIAYALQGLHVRKISVLNRHRDRAENLAGHVRKYRPLAKLVPGTFEDWPEAAKDAGLVINATSAGMKGCPPLMLDLKALPDTEAAICDIVYNPLETPLLKQARARGHERLVDGLGMLMHQAAPSFQTFFHDEMLGRPPEVSQGLRDALVKELAARG